MMGSLEMGGSQTMVMALYRAMDRSKVQFDFVLDCDTNIFEDEIRQLGGRIFRLPKFNGRNFREIRTAWKDFFANHPEYKVLHSHIRSYASLYLPIAKKYGVKTIIHSHNTSNGKGLKAIMKMALQYPLRFQADYFFGCSELAGQWLFGRKVVKSDRYFMLKNAVDVDRFSYCQEVRERIRKELACDDGTFVIGHVGRMNPQKNHRFLIECFSAIAEKKRNAKLILLGDGELRDEVAQQIAALGLEDRVAILGVKGNVEEYFSAMDCLLLPSLHEGLPVVIVEAQANGLKSFVSDTVTREVQLSQQVQYLPINQGSQSWVDAVLGADLGRKDVTEDIRKHGFCVKASSRWLCDFYLDIAR
jgi:glycosyltransferase involved in cell wall biosynthesis